jgi:hypothetical protein
MFSIFKKKPKLKTINSSNIAEVCNYSLDTEFLNKLIDTEIANWKYKISLVNITIITDNDCIEGIEEMTRNVKELMSDNYVNKILSRYINLDKLDDFLVKIITKAVVEFALGYNKRIYR